MGLKIMKNQYYKINKSTSTLMCYNIRYKAFYNIKDALSILLKQGKIITLVNASAVTIKYLAKNHIVYKSINCDKIGQYDLISSIYNM